jgi:hypothetical protein
MSALCSSAWDLARQICAAGPRLGTAGKFVESGNQEPLVQESFESGNEEPISPEKEIFETRRLPDSLGATRRAFTSCLGKPHFLGSWIPGFQISYL